MDDTRDLSPDDPSNVKISKRLRAMARSARQGRLPERCEFVGAALEIAADAMIARRTYETLQGPKTYVSPERQHAVRAMELAANIALNAKAKTNEIPDEAAPDAARERLRELGYEIVKTSGPIARA